MSACHGSMYTANEPCRLPPPWLTKRAVLLKTRSIGTSPFDVPLVPAMYEPDARMFETERPTPPLDFEICAQRFSVP